jgi:MFS family permease
LIASQLTKLNAPVLSSLASKDAGKEEQGRIQGALSALGSIAFSVGPLSMEFIYHRTKNKAHFGPGFMFYFAAGLYAIGTCLIIMVPTRFQREGSSGGIAQSDPDRLVEPGSLEEPLLQDEANEVGETLEEP